MLTKKEVEKFQLSRIAKSTGCEQEMEKVKVFGDGNYTMFVTMKYCFFK